MKVFMRILAVWLVFGVIALPMGCGGGGTADIPPSEVPDDEDPALQEADDGTGMDGDDYAPAADG